MEMFIGILTGIFLGVVAAFTNVGPEQLADVENKCKNNAGLEAAVFKPVGPPVVYCKDGAKFTLKD